jgi:hypothetical protein
VHMPLVTLSFYYRPTIQNFALNTIFFYKKKTTDPQGVK